MLNPLPGRVGDSPVAGAGSWANAHRAVSATGTGDAFFRVAFARRVADLIELTHAASLAPAERALGEVARSRVKGAASRSVPTVASRPR